MSAVAGSNFGLSGAATTSSVPWTNGIAPLHVDGNYLKDSNGSVVILRGVSIADPMELDARGAGLSAEQVVNRISDASLGYHADGAVNAPKKRVMTRFVRVAAARGTH